MAFYLGFAASELCNRIEHAEPKVIIAANCGVEPNKVIRYLDILNDALIMSEWKPLCSVIFQRQNIMTSPLLSNKDVLWETLLAHSDPVDCVPVEANDPLYLLYTSGTTSKPKGVQRPTGGHLVSLLYTMSTIYGLKPSDVWWAASDMGKFSLIWTSIHWFYKKKKTFQNCIFSLFDFSGWVVGHSYICYGPLLYGATSVMYEGKPDRTPDPGQYFRIIEQHKVSALFSIPTAFRVIRRVDPDAKFGRAHNIDSLRTIFVAGEHCDLETKSWIGKTFKVPVLNHWWQSNLHFLVFCRISILHLMIFLLFSAETGSAMTASCIGFNHSLHQPPFSTGLPFIGYKSQFNHILSI